MISWIKKHLEKRRQVSDQCKADAKKLVSSDPANSYYNAQQMAARCRCAGDTDGLMRWSRAAAEIARSEPLAEMDLDKVKAISDREEARQKQNEMRRERS